MGPEDVIAVQMAKNLKILVRADLDIPLNPPSKGEFIFSVM